MDTPWRDADTLRRLYHDEKLSQYAIAERLGCNVVTIHEWMDRHGIEARSKGEAQSLRFESDDPWKDPEVLYELYVKKRLTQPEIADRLGCGDSTVSNWISRFDIKLPWNDPTVMESLYYDRKMSQQEIASHLDCSISSVERGMKRTGIDARSNEDALAEKELSGENHYRWQGGHTTNYGHSWERQRKRRLERDGYECVVCEMTDTEHRSKHDFGLHVHHIRPKDEFIEDGELDHERANQLDNLVTLCVSCHHRWEGIPLRPQRS